MVSWWYVPLELLAGWWVGVILASIRMRTSKRFYMTKINLVVNLVITGILLSIAIALYVKGK